MFAKHIDETRSVTIDGEIKKLERWSAHGETVERAFIHGLPNRVMDGGEYTYDFETEMWRCRGTHCPGVVRDEDGQLQVGEVFFKNGKLADESGREMSDPQWTG